MHPHKENNKNLYSCAGQWNSEKENFDEKVGLTCSRTIA